MPVSKRLRLPYILLITWLSLFTASSQAADKSVVLTLVADPYCPYNCAYDAIQPGYVIDLARMIFEPEGYQVQYQILPWSRAVNEVREGNFTAAIGVSQQNGRGLILPKQSIGIVNDIFMVHRSSHWQYQGVHSLKQIHLGSVASYDYGDELNRYLKDPANQHRGQSLVGDQAVERNLRMLARKRIDAYIEDANVGFYMAATLGLAGQFKSAGSKGKSMPIYLGFSPKLGLSPKLAQLFDRRLQQLREEGKLKLLLRRYHLDDWIE
ncbi:substrate-binding periplasmic protein [Oceanospirillum beijerinckii]|uniref:substrate-binding periplasmic protein n=1 Tax=Oceanospirillum beijerinckii TaxID=64976 RepID=UPI000488BD58|nr:transporter substrate-binding domain-containing protein [Oceanospirillum beijerinckii]